MLCATAPQCCPDRSGHEIRGYRREIFPPPSHVNVWIDFHRRQQSSGARRSQLIDQLWIEHRVYHRWCGAQQGSVSTAPRANVHHGSQHPLRKADQFSFTDVWGDRFERPTHMLPTSITIATTPTIGGRTRMGAAKPVKQTTNSGAIHPPPSYGQLQEALIATCFAMYRCGSTIITFSAAFSAVGVGRTPGTRSGSQAALMILAVRTRGCAGSPSTS